MPELSVIIPTYNEALHIAGLVQQLRQLAPPGEAVEILVVDAQSPDGTATLAEAAGATVLHSPRPGRAAQMNYGAAHATGRILYFVHADVSICPEYETTIAQAVAVGHAAGCYRFRFDSAHPLLRINSYGTRFKGLMSRGGDQTLFITRELFGQLGGFNERFVVMEDFEIIQRIRRVASFYIVPQSVLVSARKYEQNGWLRVQLANLAAFMLYFMKVEPARIGRTYKALINHR
ncbi:TIGR04283 family arsenosugar biosynthesis glycosyltransferase [Hymenobacter lapidiphilus]|uniref:TIGR04283 family arsenosugar biosynthesis glycosyltransferase n=1 Tax=Hymenobacter lapidiphilus TaxID=2608003 RepID=A0A7Y7PRI2_9BACT|nr:TIGR04283 family arsenosugar biosynthesis glycosyltransferase [Hymenobacter lapidiphilus]NVO32708.1 TIGR04283 family arsenosugar biosynthesis glycosyltransferase [Hymenobacter lapidiphilus]